LICWWNIACPFINNIIWYIDLYFCPTFEAAKLFPPSWLIQLPSWIPHKLLGTYSFLYTLSLYNFLSAMNFPGSLDSVNQVVRLLKSVIPKHEARLGEKNTNRPQFKLDFPMFECTICLTWGHSKRMICCCLQKQQTIIFWTDNLAAFLSNLGLPSLLEGKTCCCLLSNLPQLHSSQLGQNDIPAPGRYDMKTVLEKCAVRMSSGISAMILQGVIRLPSLGGSNNSNVW